VTMWIWEDDIEDMDMDIVFVVLWYQYPLSRSFPLCYAMQYCRLCRLYKQANEWGGCVSMLWHLAASYSYCPGNAVFYLSLLFSRVSSPPDSTQRRSERKAISLRLVISYHR